MTDDEIEALHKQFESPFWGFKWHDFAREVERRAIAAEREACAKLCETLVDPTLDYEEVIWNNGVQECASAIRARAHPLLTAPPPATPP